MAIVSWGRKIDNCLRLRASVEGESMTERKGDEPRCQEAGSVNSDGINKVVTTMVIRPLDDPT